MGQWLRSGLRRDCCVLVAALESPSGQELKRALEAHYEDRVRPKTFYGALDTLVERGHLHRETDGIHDRYALTAGGRRALADHYEWLGERLGDPAAFRGA